jgi:hypothetical protein
MATAAFATVEPIFIRRKDLPPTSDSDTKYNILDMCLAAERVTGRETILGAQEIHGLWRIYPATTEARGKLLVQGLTVRGIHMTVHGRNPYLTRAMPGSSGIDIPSTKLWISDVPLSIADEDIESAVEKLGVVARSRLISERVRNRDGKLTRFLTGRRYRLRVCQCTGKAPAKIGTDRTYSGKTLLQRNA